MKFSLIARSVSHFGIPTFHLAIRNDLLFSQHLNSFLYTVDKKYDQILKIKYRDVNRLLSTAECVALFIEPKCRSWKNVDTLNGKTIRLQYN